jgi:hypothetical protein
MNYVVGSGGYGSCYIYEYPLDAVAHVVDQHTEWEPENFFGPEYRRYCKHHCSMRELGSLQKIKEYLFSKLIKNGNDITTAYKRVYLSCKLVNVR